MPAEHSDRVLVEVGVERRRQVAREGWSTAHDDDHGDRSLASAAASYAWIASLDDLGRREALGWLGVAQRGVVSVINHLWPNAWDVAWFKPRDRRRDLVRAAALCVAEIERIDRAADLKIAQRHAA